MIFGENIAIFGLGRSGTSLKNFLQKINFDGDIYLFDDNFDRIKEFKGQEKIIICSYENVNWKKIDYLMVSPGIDVSHPLLKFAKDTQITTDIELFYLYVVQKNPQTKFIGITGTNGKSTTTAMIHHVMKNCQLNVEIGGNIGTPIFDLKTNADFYVLEISSYQLDLMKKVHFYIGILLNITPDHLDRYNFRMSNYISSKKRILKISQNVIINTDNEHTNQIFNEITNKNNILITSTNKNADYICKSESDDKFSIENTLKSKYFFKSKLLGSHNRENIVACFACCDFLQINNQQTIENIQTFEPLPHRLQLVRSVKNLNFVNDSKATSGEATLSAINAFENDLHIILGGVPKTDGLTPLKNVLNKVKKFYLIGQSSNEFYEFLLTAGRKADTVICDNLEDACKAALEYCQTEIDCDIMRIILFSPACASFDQFRDFEDRGEKFIEIVSKLTIKDDEKSLSTTREN